MRRRNSVTAALLCGLAASAAIPASAVAAPHHNDGLTLASTPSHIVAGTGVLIYGKLTGNDVADQTVHLYHRIAPAARFTIIGSTKTNAEGFFEFTRAEGVVVTNRDWFVRGPEGTHSHTIRERVASTLTLSESASSAATGQKVVFDGSVYPAHAGQRVDIQEQDSTTGNGWRTIASGRTNSVSGFSIAHGFRDAGDYTLRAYLPADARNTAGSSDSTTLEVQQTQNPSFTITSSAPSITTGQALTLSGTEYMPGSSTVGDPAQAVNLYAKAPGSGFKEIATTTTDASGAYSFSQAPTANTVYKVENAAAPAQHTANLYEAVADTISLTASATSGSVGTPITFSGTVTPDHAGHWVVLQVQTAKGGWQDVATTQVGANSDYSLSYDFGKPGTFSVRARIFGGPVNVGAASTPVSVTESGYASAAALPAS